MRKKLLKLAFVLGISLIGISSAISASVGVTGGDVGVKAKSVTFNANEEPYTLTITTSGGWSFKTANVSNGISWDISGLQSVDGSTSITTSLEKLGPEAFTITVYGDLNPPPGPGSGPVNYEVTGDLNGTLTIDLDQIAGVGQSKPFKAMIDSKSVTAKWKAERADDNLAATCTVNDETADISASQPGIYFISAEAGGKKADKAATLTVIGLEISGKDIIEMGGSIDFNLTVTPSNEDISAVSWTCAKGGTFTPEQGASTTWTTEPGYASNGTADVRIRANYSEDIKGEKYVAVVKVQSLTAESEYGTASNGATLGVMPNTSVTFRALSSHGSGSTWPQNYPQWTLDGEDVSSPGSSTYTYTFAEGNHQVSVSCGTSERRVNIKVAAGITMVYQVLGDTYWSTASPDDADYKSIAQYAMFNFAANLVDCNGMAMTVKELDFNWGGEADGRTGSALGVTFSEDPGATPLENVSVSAGDFSIRQYFYVMPLDHCTIWTRKTSNPPDTQSRRLEDTEIQTVGETYEFTLHPPLLYSIADLQNMLKLKYEIWDATQIDTYGAQPIATGYGRTIVHTWNNARSVKIRFYFDNGCDGQSVTWVDEQTVSLSDPRKTSPAFNVQ